MANTSNRPSLLHQDAPEFIAAVQEALSGLEKIVVTGEDIKKALLTARDA